MERQRLVDLKVKADEAAQLKEKERKDKEIADAAAKNKQWKEKKKEKKGKKKTKAVMESSSEKEMRNATEATLAKDKRETDEDTKREKSGTLKEQYKMSLRWCQVLCQASFQAYQPQMYLLMLQAQESCLLF